MAGPERVTTLSRTAASGPVESIGWRYLLGCLSTSVAVSTLEHGMAVAQTAVGACADEADRHLRADVRPDRVDLTLQDRGAAGVTETDVALAQRITEVLGGIGAVTAGTTSDELSRPVQMLEMAIDALDIGAIRPFWKAVLAYVDEPGDNAPGGGIVDPAGQLPTIWFQQMDAPRPQRNRVHFDITVAHDEAEARVRAALAANGVMVNDSYARSFWVLADVEGNEVCVCTWTDRDERGW